ncbi:3-oxoacyl-ACP synthase [Lewinella sp. W8]|uniref:3-oxoacyl-ACP synthase n=1 Tax=Lewinella sp. W8 TaxID=2528208 RepID=UPI00106858BB|nr:3-oxoacyl-ACP synthase [Lewinella sp. W8]MTB50993.1 3-oxoacyl-ACP synthase [Lewinella sp. W8]
MPSVDVPELKRRLFAECKRQLRERTEKLEDALRNIVESRDGETKSSAGDKFETGRAMMQLEEAKLRGQLAEAGEAYDRLLAIDLATPRQSAGAGALVGTNRGNFFIATGIGKVTLDGRPFFCTSPVAPIARAMLGKGVGEELVFNGVEFIILELA